MPGKKTVPAEADARERILAAAGDVFAESGYAGARIDDFGFEAGGPIIRDRLWLWGAASSNNIDNFSSGDALVTRTELTNYNGKLNAQITTQNNAELFYMFSDKTVAGRGLSATRPLETARNQSGPSYIFKLQDTHIFSQRLYLTGTLAKVGNGYELDPIGGRDVDAYWVDGGIADDDDPSFTSGWHRSYQYFFQEVPQQNARIDGSTFVDLGETSHELKFGFGYRDTPVESGTIWPGNGNFANFYDGYAYAALTRPALPNYESNYWDAYLGDTIIYNNFTFTAGLRFDRQSAKNNPGSVPANPVVPDLLPAAEFAGDDRSLEWNGISPRLGMTWVLGPQKKSVIRANYSRYIDQLGSSDAGASNPFYRVQELYYYWEDLNGDRTIQRGEIDFDSGLQSFSNIDPNNPGAGFSPGRLDYDMKPPTTDEFVLGFTQELGSSFGVGANYSYRYRKNFTWEQYEKTRGAGDFYTSADYVACVYGVNCPASARPLGTLPDGTPYDVQTYRLRPGLSAPTYFVITNRDDYSQTYNGLELFATKRMTDGWMMRGNVTFMDWRQQVGDNGFVNPTPIVSGDSCTSCDDAAVASSGGSGGYINSRWAASLNTAVNLPYQLLFGAAVTAREGYIIPYYRRVNNSDRLGNQNVMVVGDFDSERLPNVFNLDLRIARDFRVRDLATVNLSLDLFNATNERTVLWRDNRMYALDGSDSDNNWIEQLQSPRIWRLGARVSF